MADAMYPFRRPQEPPVPSGQVRQAGGGTPSTAPAPTPVSGSPGLPTPGDPRQAALQMLLDEAALYGDQGASTATITSLLNGVDMGRADRATAMYATRQQQMQDSGKTYLDALAAALTKRRQMAGSRRSSSGKPPVPPTATYTWTPFDWRTLFPISAPAAPSTGAPSGARGGSIRGSVDI